MNHTALTWQDVERQVQDILRQIQRDAWQPDYVVGLTRGGLVPATMISNYLDCTMHTLQVSLRDSGECESNLWMAEDAFGYELDRPVRILIVDDINDSGATLNWIQKDWMTSCRPNDPRWNDVWGNNVRVAVLVNNQASLNTLRVNYHALQINKRERDVWIDFPWEIWWRR